MRIIKKDVYYNIINCIEDFFLLLSTLGENINTLPSKSPLSHLSHFFCMNIIVKWPNTILFHDENANVSYIFRMFTQIFLKKSRMICELDVYGQNI